MFARLARGVILLLDVVAVLSISMAAGLSPLGMATTTGASYRHSSNAMSVADSDSSSKENRDSMAVDTCGSAAKV